VPTASKAPTWQEFCEVGDQWLVSYLFSTSLAPAPALFTIGHCLEAYCKAVILKDAPNTNIYQKRYGHNIEDMLLEIKGKIGILKGVEFLPNVRTRFMTGGPIPFTDSLMSDPEYLHYLENQELYWVSKFQKDLKYIGTSGEKMPSQFSFMVMERNPYWIPILKEMRSFLRQGEPNETISISRIGHSKALPTEKESYLEAILGKMP
jgi:hypothetical protein